MNKIVILSLEGTKSNTEINFFRGLNHCISLPMTAFALGKASPKKTKAKKALKGRINDMMQTHHEDFEGAHIFCIADHDRANEVPSILEAFNIIKDEFESTYSIWKCKINPEIIWENGKSFDDVLKQDVGLGESVIFDNDLHKKATYHNFFNDLCKIKNVDVGDEESVKKFLENIFKDTMYIEIINLI